MDLRALRGLRAYVPAALGAYRAYRPTVLRGLWTLGDLRTYNSTDLQNPTKPTEPYRTYSSFGTCGTYEPTALQAYRPTILRGLGAFGLWVTYRA